MPLRRRLLPLHPQWRCCQPLLQHPALLSLVWLLPCFLRFLYQSLETHVKWMAFSCAVENFHLRNVCLVNGFQGTAPRVQYVEKVTIQIHLPYIADFRKFFEESIPWCHCLHGHLGVACVCVYIDLFIVLKKKRNDFSWYVYGKRMEWVLQLVMYSSSGGLCTSGEWYL